MRLRIKKHIRSVIAQPRLQRLYRLLYRISLMGMNYGGAASSTSSGDAVALYVLARLGGTSRPNVFDVGANVGQYTSLVLEHLEGTVQVWAFEPSRAAFERLTEKFSKRAGVNLVRAALTDEAGRRTLFNDLQGSVHGSVFPSALAFQDGGLAAAEEVETLTLDEFCKERGIECIDLLKLDVEGGELDALKGARRLLERGAVRLIQFEFGQPSIGAKVSFYDLFVLLDQRFELYRVLPHGLVRLDDYHESLEVYMATNYLAIVRSEAKGARLE